MNEWPSDCRVSFPCPGSIRDIPSIPLHVKDVFMTAWEIDPKIIVDMAADRGPFIDQTQSMSLTVSVPNPVLMVRDYSMPNLFSDHGPSWTCRCTPGGVVLRLACTTCARRHLPTRSPSVSALSRRRPPHVPRRSVPLYLRGLLTHPRAPRAMHSLRPHVFGKHDSFVLSGHRFASVDIDLTLYIYVPSTAVCSVFDQHASRRASCLRTLVCQFALFLPAFDHRVPLYPSRPLTSQTPTKPYITFRVYS